MTEFFSRTQRLKGAQSSASKNLETVRMGWIDYHNLLPLKIELQNSIKKGFSLKPGYPSQVNGWLLEGEVDLAPASSINLLLQPRSTSILQLGVAAMGAVQSVYFGFAREHEEFLQFLRMRQENLVQLFKKFFKEAQPRQLCKQIFEETEFVAIPKNLEIPHLTFASASASSNKLACILLRLWLGKSGYEEIVSTHRKRAEVFAKPVDLQIGDQALERRQRYFAKLDLAELWFELTRMPFVFAVWQSRIKLNEAFAKKIYQLAERAEATMAVEPSKYLSAISPAPVDDCGDLIDLGGYWRNLHYTLGPDDMRSLLLFFCFAKLLLNREQQEALIENIMYYEGVFGRSQSVILGK